MATRGQDIVSLIKRQIEEFGGDLALVDVGTVVQVGDGVPLPLDVRSSPFHEGLGLLTCLVHLLGAEPFRRFPRLVHDALTFTPGLGYLLLYRLLR